MEKINYKVDYINDPIAKLTSKCEHKTLAIWATDCTERVLAYFEETHPNDYNPRNAIEAGRAWVRGELKMTDARKAALVSHISARKASDDSAIAVARACGHAAATAHVATHAIHAATYAVKAVGYAKYDTNNERDWQYNHLLELYKKEEKKLIKHIKYC